MKRLSEVIASHTSTSRRPQDQQRLLDQIVNLISSPPQDFSHLQRLLDQLDSDKIDGLHSIIQFSPLEALLSRYPKLVQEDFKILEKLLEKGADLGKVQREILERMVEAEIDEGDEVLKVFEKRLIKEFEKLDKITNEGEGNVEAESPTALDPPRQSTPVDPRRQEEIARRSPSLTPLPPSRNVSLIALSDLSQTSSHSQPHRPASVSPDTSRSLRPPSRDSPPFLPPPRSPLPLLARPDPSELIRLCTRVPEGTTMSSLWYYFHAVLRVQIFNPYLQIDRPPFHAFFKVEKRLFESGELESRLREMAFNGNPFISVQGNRWIFDISIARESAPRSNFQPLIEPSNDLLFTRREEKNYGERPRDQHGWVKITLSGFSMNTKPSEIESTLQRILTYWRDFEVRSSEDGQESVVELKVRGSNAVSLVESEFRNHPFGGRFIQIKKEDSVPLFSGWRRQDHQETQRDEGLEEWEFGEAEKRDKVKLESEEAKKIGIERETVWEESSRNKHQGYGGRQESGYRREDEREDYERNERSRKRSNSRERRRRSRSRSRSRSCHTDTRSRKHHTRSRRDYDSDSEEERYSSRRRRRRNRSRSRSRSRSPRPPRRSQHRSRKHSYSRSPPPERRRPKLSRYRSSSRSRSRSRTPPRDYNRYHSSRKHRSPSITSARYSHSHASQSHVPAHK